MSGYRPPRRHGSPYITADGAAALRAELKQLWEVERPQVTNVVHEAAKNGDRSENGDYIYGKRRLAEIDRRVRYLTKRLEVLKIVNEKPTDHSKVYFGARVELENEDGALESWRIVGPDEFDPSAGTISMDSPLARALLGKRLDDEVLVNIPEGQRALFITAIQYD